jgi:hypothetical protein
LHKLNVLYDWRSIKFIETVRRKKKKWMEKEKGRKLKGNKEENEKETRKRIENRE